MSESKGVCFVMQPFDRARYDSLYSQVFAPAIRNANLEPYRVDNDPGASVPIETIEEQIIKAAACFGEISEDNPNVWFELGFAIAREKPLCLVCSTTRTKFPFDVQHRKIITYPTQPLPKDYEDLKSAITSRLVAAVSKEEARRQNAEAASTLSVVPETSGLAPHELLALTLILEEQFSDGTPPHRLAESMHKGGYIKTAANLAVAGLLRKGLAERRRVIVEDNRGNQWPEDNFFVTEQGQDWLVSNQEKLNLRLASSETSTKQTEIEITDDDIPF